MPFVGRDSAGAINGLYEVAQSPDMKEWLPETDPVIVAYRNPPPPPLTIIYKRNIWLAATDAEAATIDAQLKQASVRLQRMWSDSEYLATTDPLYPMIQGAFTAAFGADRATQLLAPTA